MVVSGSLQNNQTLQQKIASNAPRSVGGSCASPTSSVTRPFRIAVAFRFEAIARIVEEWSIPTTCPWGVAAAAASIPRPGP